MALVAFAATGCSAIGADNATTAAREFTTAVAEQRVDAACALVAPRAAENCATTVSSLGDQGSVNQAEVWGEDAKATTRSGVLFLHEFSNGWLVTGAGCRHRGDEPYDCAVGGP